MATAAGPAASMDATSRSMPFSFDRTFFRFASGTERMRSSRSGSRTTCIVWVGSARFAVEVRDPRSLRGRTHAGDDHGPRKIVATMPGKVVRLLVREGDEVEAGAGIAVVEAMKMQNEIKSPKKGTVQKILAAEARHRECG